jgi:hypothetical protein
MRQGQAFDLTAYAIAGIPYVPALYQSSRTSTERLHNRKPQAPGYRPEPHMSRCDIPRRCSFKVVASKE